MGRMISLEKRNLIEKYLRAGHGILYVSIKTGSATCTVLRVRDCLGIQKRPVGRSPISESVRAEIRNGILDGLSYCEIARRHGVSPTGVRYIHQKMQTPEQLALKEKLMRGESVDNT